MTIQPEAKNPQIMENNTVPDDDYECMITVLKQDIDTVPLNFHMFF